MARKKKEKKEKKVDTDFVWRVSMRQPDLDEKPSVSIEFGEQTSPVVQAIDDESKIRMLGEALVVFGTRLMSGTIEEEEI